MTIFKSKNIYLLRHKFRKWNYLYAHTMLMQPFGLHNVSQLLYSDKSAPFRLKVRTADLAKVRQAR